MTNVSTVSTEVAFAHGLAMSAFGSPAFGSPAFGSPALGSPALGSPALGSNAVIRTGAEAAWRQAMPAQATYAPAVAAMTVKSTAPTTAPTTAPATNKQHPLAANAARDTRTTKNATEGPSPWRSPV